MKNNQYLHSLLLGSSLINYNHSSTWLGMESGLALYLFGYSSDLFFNYHRDFIEFPMITNSYANLNTYWFLLQDLPTVSLLDYEQRISFKYYSNYDYTIEHTDNLINSDILFNYNEPVSYSYNGVNFKLPSIENIICYCLYYYNKEKYKLSRLIDLCLFTTIYYFKIMNNSLLSNILQLKLNSKKLLKTALQQFESLDLLQYHGFDFDQETTKERVVKTLEFCYDI